VKDTEVHEGNVGTIWHLQDGEIRADKWCRKYGMRWIFRHSKEHNRQVR